MEPKTSRGLTGPPGSAPPGRFLFPRRRFSLAWLLPAAAVHLVLLFALVSTSTRTVRVERPLPRWALMLTPPEIVEPGIALPQPPAALPAPRVARPTERTVQPTAEPVTMAGPPIADSALVPRLGDAGGVPGPVAPGLDAPRPPVAERLRPGRGDRRLYIPLPREIVGLSADQLAQLEIDLAVAEVLDSIEAAEAAGRRATDWTYTDAEGRRWGVSPGQIHLGGITIPLPFGFSAPRTADATRRSRQDAEIAAQADRQGATTVLKDRAAEIRRRRDAERSRARVRTAVDSVGGV